MAKAAGGRFAAAVRASRQFVVSLIALLALVFVVFMQVTATRGGMDGTLADRWNSLRVFEFAQYIKFLTAAVGAMLVLLAWLVVGGLGGTAQGKLSGVQSNDNSTFLPKSAESTLVSEAVAQLNESDTLPYLVVVERADGAALTPEDLGALAAGQLLRVQVQATH